MTRLIGLVVCFSICLGGYASPVVASAGDISLQHLDDRESNKAKVASRLEEVGYSEEEAVAQVSTMTADELDFFANHPESIERTGFIILGSLIGSSINSSVQQNKKKKAEEEARVNLALENEKKEKKERTDRYILTLEDELEMKKHQEMLAVAGGGRASPALVKEIEELRKRIRDLRFGYVEMPDASDSSDEATPDEEASLDEGATPDEEASLDDEATPDEEASLDEGATPDGEASLDEGATPDEEASLDEGESLDEGATPDQDNPDE